MAFCQPPKLRPKTCQKFSKTAKLHTFCREVRRAERWLGVPKSFERKRSLQVEGSADSCRVSRSLQVFKSLRSGLCGPSGLAGSLSLQVLIRALRSFGACRVPCFASLGTSSAVHRGLQVPCFASLETGSAVLRGLQGPLLCKSWNVLWLHGGNGLHL